MGDAAATDPPLTTTPSCSSSSSSSSRASEKLSGSGFPFASMPVLEASSWASSSSAAVRIWGRCGVWAAEEEEWLAAAGVRAVRSQRGASVCERVLCACVRGVRATQGASRGRGRGGASVAGMSEETRTGGSQACSWWRFNVKVEVDERVEFLERERLRRLVVDEHTLPFLRGLLIALEHYHLIILDKYRISRHQRHVCVCGGETE